MKYIREFFVNEHPFVPYKPFGFIHCFCILLVIIGLILIYINRNKISELPEKTKRHILKTIAIIMLINMLIYNIAPHVFGYFDYKIHLPFQLCFSYRLLVQFLQYYGQICRQPSTTLTFGNISFLTISLFVHLFFLISL